MTYIKSSLFSEHLMHVNCAQWHANMCATSGLLSQKEIMQWLRNNLMCLLAQLHHTTVRFSALFANSLPKTVSDSCRNIASIPTYSLTIMFDIKGHMPRITLFYLCPFIFFFNGRYSCDYILELWNWPGENISSFNSDSLRLVKECNQRMHCQNRKFPRNNRKLFLYSRYLQLIV